MNRRTFLGRSALAVSGLIISASGMRLETPPSAGTSLLRLSLEGPPRQRGRIHGETLRSKIRELIARWKEDIGRSLEMDPDEYLKEFNEATNFRPAIERWCPDLLEEVAGIAEGAGVDYQTMYSFQMGDEHYWHQRRKWLEKSGWGARGCSALGVFGEGQRRPLLAQNMDIETMYDGAQLLLHIEYPESSLESFVYTNAGYLALTGLNNQPLGICCNALLQLNYAVDGLPVSFIVRRVLELPSLSEARKFLSGIKHASGQNYMVGDAGKVESWECSGSKVSLFVPQEGATRVYHTNHPLANDDQSIYRGILDRIPPEKKPKGRSNSEVRQEFLEERLKDNATEITVDTIKSILGSREVPICFENTEGSRGFTFGCLIMELASGPTLHLSPGPPCSTPFQTFRF
jgi:isopenicillin-N N-acyltransferase-like protein